ncbi:MAG: M20/M25/M40 family metallo-hydrolase [Candidatus Aminicenantes bacterium]|nr:M20/M25/M40 family metallo-hydrolase [Candidatus Aminicenantes bacterium]
MASEIRTHVLDLIEAWEEEQLDFLIALCNQNSYTFHKKGTDRVAAMILEKLYDVFPIHQKIEQSEVGDHHILKTGTSGKFVYLLGHMDTVFPPDHSFQTCRRDGDWLGGPGTADMKGGLVVIIYALKALNQAGVLDSLDVAFILGGDEENGSITSQKIYEEERQKAWICLVGECAGENGEIVVSRNGKAGGRLDCYGRDRHVGAPTEEKTSAILELAHHIIAFEALNGMFPGVRVNAGRIEGGLGPGTVPAQASLLFDLRWEKEEHFAPLYRRIQEIAARPLQPQGSSRLTLGNHRPAMPASPKTETAISLLRKTAGVLGQEITTEHRRGTSDGNYFGAAGVPTLDGFGPVGIMDHTPEERILITSLKARTSLLASYLLRLKDVELPL